MNQEQSEFEKENPFMYVESLFNELFPKRNYSFDEKITKIQWERDAKLPKQIPGCTSLRDFQKKISAKHEDIPNPSSAQIPKIALEEDFDIFNEEDIYKTAFETIAKDFLGVDKIDASSIHDVLQTCRNHSMKQNH